MSETLIKIKEPSSVNETVGTIMRVLSKELDIGANFLDEKIITSYSQIIYEFITDPIASTTYAIETAQEKSLDIISRFVKVFLVNQKDIIESVYKSNLGNCLQYFIVLKVDTMDNRSKLNEFLALYERLKISDNKIQKLHTMFPVHFEYISKEMISEISRIELVNLLDEPLFKTS